MVGKAVYCCRLLGISALLFLSVNASAARYIAADDWRLRQDIFTLANAGVLPSTVTSFPVAWDSIINVLRERQPKSLNWPIEQARLRLMRAYQKANVQTHVRGYANLSSKSPKTATETKQVSTNAELGLAASYAEGPWLVNADISLASSPIDEFDQSAISFDNSFAGVQWGNWLFSAGYMKHKFGPGNDTQLFRSTNAEAPPSFYISRVMDSPFETQWLSWIGNWTFINGVSLLDDDRAVNDAVLWTMRASFRPFDFVEFGMSKAAQLCGEGKSCNFSAWRRTFSGDTNVWSGENPANQVAGVDVRFSGLALDVPFEVYWESIGEDAVRLNRYPPFQAKSHLFGSAIDIDLGRLFVEFSDTGAHCSNGLNCTYEHSTYRSGYRYKRKTFGSTYDNDTKAFVLGLRSQFSRDEYAALHLRVLDQNYDDINSGLPGGNPVAKNRQKVSQLELLYGFPLTTEHYDLGSMALGSQLNRTSEGTDESLDLELWLTWEKSLY